MGLPESDLLGALLLFLVLSVLGVGLLAATRHHRDTLGFQVGLFLLAMGVRFGASLAISYGGLLDVIKEEDSALWITGLYIKRDWQRYGVGLLELPGVLLEAAYDPESIQGRRGYMFLLAGLYYFWDAFDPGRLVAAVLNNFFGALTAVFTYRIAKTLFNRRVAAWSGWFVCLFPSLIGWSAQTLKEPVVILVEMVVLYACTSMLTRGQVYRYLALSLAMIVLLVPFRGYAASLTAGIVIFTLISLIVDTSRFGIRTIVALGAAYFIGTAMLGALAPERERLNVEYFASVKLWQAEGAGSAVENPFDMRTPIGLVLATLFGALHFLFAPFPWQWSGGSSRLVLTAPEVIVWSWAFFIGVLPGLRHAFRTHRREIQPILLFLIGSGLVYSALFANVGLAFRQRAQLLPALLIFAAVGLEQRRERRAARRRPVLLTAPREDIVQA